MAHQPVARGEIAEGGAFELLREIEAKRLTGSLEFEGIDDPRSAKIALFGGEIAVEQESLDDGTDPVDLLLEIGAARYSVHQRLPPLAVSRGDEYQKHGSLSVHVPADLMNYCEHAGLSGVLELRHEGRRAEAFYRAGELVAIQLDGDDVGDLQEVFGWEQGRFKIRLDPIALERFDAPPPAEESEPELDNPGWTGEATKARSGENTQKFLRVVEVALADVVAKSERARSPTRTSPPLPPSPPKRKLPSRRPPSATRRRDEQTVQLIYLSADGAGLDEGPSTRHVRSDKRVVAALPDAQPERRALSEETDSMAKKRRKKKRGASRSSKKPVETSAAEAKEESAPAVEREARPVPEEKAAEEEASKPERAAPMTMGETAKRAGVALAWAATVIVLGIGILAFLAILPPVGGG